MTDNSEPRRIMVVDDNIDHLLVSKLILERRGYEVLTLNRCEGLNERVLEYRPALIFMDHDMPDMTGLEATRKIKADENCKHIPVVYFTSREDIRDLAAESGADDWLKKPFLLEELVETAKRFI